jgi:CheY-like chemotaxis protein
LARILVIDDDAAICVVLRIALEYKGYEVVEAHNGFEGLQCYEAAPVDLVITDLQMPEMDGLQMLSELRRRSPKVKVIAISGRRKALAIAEEFYAQRTFEKPFCLKEVLGAVEDLISTPEIAAWRSSRVADSSCLHTRA